MKKDTERVDEIRAMKKAWEDAEPGRAAKAMQSRLQYLSTHLVKVKQLEYSICLTVYTAKYSRVLLTCILLFSLLFEVIKVIHFTNYVRNHIFG